MSRDEMYIPNLIKIHLTVSDEVENTRTEGRTGWKAEFSYVHLTQDLHKYKADDDLHFALIHS
jgi:hypothetical protein